MDIPVVAMILRSGWVARIILFVLAILSVITWAIIFNRLFVLMSVGKRNRLFRESFRRSRGIAELEKLDERLGQCPLGRLGRAGAGEYRRILEDAHAHSGVKDWSFFLQNQFAMASERFESLFSSVAGTLDKGLFLLAICSSIAPFLGLLGTVWGIMNSFYQIGNQGSASLPVVAPGIAEALITTIVGLAVAIPAVFFYNYLMHRAQRIEDEMGEFVDIILSRLKREIFGLLYKTNPAPGGSR